VRCRWTVLGLIGALGCAPKISANALRPESPDRSSRSFEARLGDEATDSPWDCRGPYVPPTGYLQEMSWIKESEAGEQDPRRLAARHARIALVERLCAGSASCDRLASEVDIWRSGWSAARDGCAMAVVEETAYQRWLASTRTVKQLDRDLLDVAQALLADAPTTNGTPRLAIDKVLDAGSPGGPRASWLAGRMEAALWRAGASVRAVPKTWSGLGLPRGLDAVLDARVFTRREEGVPVVEVVWSATVRGTGRVSERRVGPSVAVPREAVPSDIEELRELPVAEGNISIRVPSAPGGSLCPNSPYEIWLETDSDLHVRVFNLYGDGRATLIFPEASIGDLVLANRPLRIGPPAGFAAVPLEGDVDRYLVVAAPRREDLGPLADYGAAGYCRVDPPTARNLHTGQALPDGALVTSTGYRIVDSPGCPPVHQRRSTRELLKQLEALPVCATSSRKPRKGPVR
jgi:hypothetical protein